MHLHHAAAQPLPAQLLGHLFGEPAHAQPHLVLADEIAPERHAAADVLTLRAVGVEVNGRVVQPVAGAPQRLSALAHPLDQPLFGLCGQRADGIDPLLGQPRRRRFADEQHLGHRQRPEQRAVVLRRNDRGRVRLFIVAAHLGERLVERHAHGDRHADFLAHAAAQFVGQLAGGHAVIAQAAGEIEKALVDRGRLHIVGIGEIDRVDRARNLRVQLMPRRHEHNAGALALRRPHSVGGLYARALGQLVFGHDDAVPVLRIARHGHGHILQLRMIQTLAGREKIVAVAMENQPRRIHAAPSPLCFHKQYSTFYDP